VGSAASSFTLTTAWQPVSVSYTPVAPGASTLDFQAFISSAPPGTCFYADDVGITVGSGAEVGPAASLRVTPLWVAVGMAVTADASHSSDLDLSSIATYTFDFSDGTLVGPQASAMVTHTFGASGTFLVTVVVADSAGLQAGAAATVVVDAAPVAALSLTPVAGLAPLAVSADASGSADLDGTPIASYLFNFGDGSLVGPQATAVATHTYLTGGSYVVAVSVADTAGLTSTATAGLLVRAELVGNPGFETSSDGWNTAGVIGVTLDRVPGGHSGNWSALLANTGPTPTYCVLNDSPNWVQDTAAGTYTGTIWVRADSASASVSLGLREYNTTGTFLGETERTVTLTTDWQQISVTYVPISPGSSSLDFQVEESGAPTGTCFYADDANIGLS
jgi:PKD domain-containing protein/carbohydrate binding protein with CBM4/9 domain